MVHAEDLAFVNRVETLRSSGWFLPTRASQSAGGKHAMWRLVSSDCYGSRPTRAFLGGWVA